MREGGGEGRRRREGWRDTSELLNTAVNNIVRLRERKDMKVHVGGSEGAEEVREGGREGRAGGGGRREQRKGVSKGGREGGGREGGKMGGRERGRDGWKEGGRGEWTMEKVGVEGAEVAAEHC